jgi:hypothetical protein
MWDGALLILPKIHAHMVQISPANPLAFFRQPSKKKQKKRNNVIGPRLSFATFFFLSPTLEYRRTKINYQARRKIK